MRKIKFRAWDDEDKKYYTVINLPCDPFKVFNNIGRIIERPCNLENDPIDVEFIDLIIEQFTGFKDKNGKDVYEGDILFGREEGDGETSAWTDVYYTVFFKDGSFMVRDQNTSENSDWCSLLIDVIEEYEIIGNIHENLELLS